MKVPSEMIMPFGNAFSQFSRKLLSFFFCLKKELSEKIVGTSFGNKKVYIHFWCKTSPLS